MSEDTHDITDGPVPYPNGQPLSIVPGEHGNIDKRLRTVLVEVMALRLQIDETLDGMERALAEVRAMCSVIERDD